MNTLEVVTTPTFAWLAKRAQACAKRVLIGSPYVNQGLIGLTGLISANVSRTLVTRTDLRDFAVGSSNLGTLCTLANDGVAVFSLKALHAKMYIFDDTAALVTSANATNGGLRRNLECGLSTHDTGTVRNLAMSLLSGLGADAPPRRMRLLDLERLYAPLEGIKAILPKQPGIPTPGDVSGGEITYLISDEAKLLDGYTGWRRLTLRGVLAMPPGGFAIGDLLKVCGPEAASRYPKNQHVSAKLRQQLQMLRGDGLVEFVTPGYYRRTMN